MVELPDAGLSSRRLSLEFPRDSDAAETAAAMTPNVARWLITWPSPLTEEKAAEKIQACRQGIAFGDAMHFVLRSLADQALVGWTSAWRDEAPDEWQFGFWIGEAFQGQGHGFEAASTVLDHVIVRANPRAVGAIVDPDNVPSIAILQKLGMTQVGETSRTIAYSGRVGPALVFRRQLEP
jgi:RimJ/RimL family protein N-acetyltransferase